MQHIPRKRFGQNFLQDQYIINKIIQCIDPKPEENILEIGPGLAALTKPLIEIAGHIQVLELDRDIIKFLEGNFSKEEIKIHAGDALAFDFGGFNNLRVVGNLPYNISTPILFHLQKFDNIKDMTFMLQKEVVDRICANPGNGNYGRLSIMLQYKYKCRKLLDVPPESFYPAPKVDSAIVSIKPRIDYDWSLINVKQLNHITTQAFNQRRKTVANSLKTLFSQEQLIQFGINPSSRAENLTVEDYLRLSQVE